jgi:hypothetical protein
LVVGLVLAVCAMTIGPANAQIESITGVPMVNAPGWWKYLTGGATANVVAGTAPAGWGDKSLVMTTGTNQAVVSTDLLFVPGISKVSSINELSYWTYSVPSQTASPKAPTMQIAVDLDADFIQWDSHLVYEPSFNAPVVAGQWQFWDTLDGLWYLTRPTADFPFGQNNPATLGTIFSANGGLGYEMTFSLLPADPGGDLRVQFGSSGGGYPGNVARVDGVRFQLGILPNIETDFDDIPDYIARLLDGFSR